MAKQRMILVRTPELVNVWQRFELQTETICCVDKANVMEDCGEKPLQAMEKTYPCSNSKL
jgi:hypothetical protein